LFKISNVDDFKPASVDTSKPGNLDVGEGGEVNVSLPNTQVELTLNFGVLIHCLVSTHQ
jgi:hypothetical protein